MTLIRIYECNMERKKRNKNTIENILKFSLIDIWNIMNIRILKLIKMIRQYLLEV